MLGVPSDAASEYVLTTTTAARRLGLSHDTVAKLADNGRLQHARTPGGHRRFRERDVESLRRQLTVAAP